MKGVSSILEVNLIVISDSLELVTERGDVPTVTRGQPGSQIVSVTVA